MAKQIIHKLVDDLDGGDADETVKFALDGIQYEIDLSKKNADKLRELIAPYVGAGSKMGRGGVVVGGRAAAARTRGGAARLLSLLTAERGTVAPRTCDLLGELMSEQGDLEGALDWATAGVERCLQLGDDAELQLLLRLRYRMRVDLGLDEDDYDRMLDDTRGTG